MKKLNEIVANELLHELKEKWDFDWIKDNVNVRFYAKYDMEQYFIGQFYSIDMLGEYLMEQFTVKGFKFEVEDSKRFDNKFVAITIVLNM